MSLRTQFLRARKYLRRSGPKASVDRLVLELKNRVSRNRLVLFSRDLFDGTFEGYPVPEGCRIERFSRRSEIPERLLERITEFSSEEILERYMRKRFEYGASLWCLRNEAEDIGYMWTLTNQAMKAFCLPPMGHDVYIMDSFVFPAHRGGGMSSVLRNYVLRHYKNEGFCRAYNEAWEWNAPVMRAMAKNGFHPIGKLRKRCRRGKEKWTFLY
jgi:GNAT superfamily N-acetyltransferase